MRTREMTFSVGSHERSKICSKNSIATEKNVARVVVLAPSRAFVVCWTTGSATQLMRLIKMNRLFFRDRD